MTTTWAAKAGGFRKQALWWLTKWIVRPYLAFLASAVRLTRRPIVIGITGSVGKTTTTAAIAAVLKHPSARQLVGNVGHTKNDMNSLSGVPLTILGYDKYLPDNTPARLAALARLPWWALFSHDYPRVLVLEMGTCSKGQIDALARQARPDVGVVTAIGPSHLDRLGTVEGVADEKSALVRWTSPSGLVVLGEGHDYLERLRSRARAPVVTVTGRGVELAQNIARVVGRHLGVSDAVIEEALAELDLPKGRLNRYEVGDITIIDDSYNANPLSMKLGLDTLAAQPAERRVALLGMMGEMGRDPERYHCEVGEYARGRCDLLVGVGEAARYYGPDYWFATSRDCADAIAGMVRPRDCVLVKGSASVGMATIVEKLRGTVPSGKPTEEL